MARQVTCECGYVARGSTDDEVVELTKDHLRSEHPGLLDAVSAEVIRGWVEVVP